MDENLDFIISLDNNELIDLTQVDFVFDKSKTKIKSIDFSIFNQEDMIDFSHLD